MKKIVLLLGLMVLAMANCLNAQPALLKNINTDNNCSQGYGMTDATYHNSKLLYVAYDKYNRQQIWKSDGTPDGTGVIKDLNPDGSYSFTGFGKLSGGRGLFIRGTGSPQVTELWKTDFTSNGTQKIATLSDSTRTYNNGIQFKNFLGSVGNKFYFMIQNDSFAYINNLNTFYYDLWVTDETAIGTTRIATMNNLPLDWEFVNNRLLMIFDGDIYNYGYGNNVLYATDGVSLTPLALIPPTWGGYFPYNGNINTSYSQLMAPLGNKVIFPGEALGVVDTLQDWEVWSSDGTIAGTGILKEIYPDESQTQYGIRSSKPYSLEVCNGKVFFGAKNLNLTYIDHDSLPTPVEDVELWSTDGTSLGTVRVKDINVNDTLDYYYYWLYQWGKSSFPSNLKAVGNTLYFTATDQVQSNNYVWGLDNDLWKSNGTATGTVKVKEMDYAPFNFSDFTSLGSKLLFTAYNGGYEIWSSSGSASGTVKVSNTVYPSGVQGPNVYTVVGTNAYFAADNGVSGNELWKTNGTASGTSMVMDINPGVNGSINNANGDLYGGGSFLFFHANNGNEYALYKSSGTSGTTSILRKSSAINCASNPRYFTDVNGTVYFSAETSTLGRELYKTNGTSAGTTVTNLNPGAAGSDPKGLINYNGKLYFWGENPTNGREVWKADPVGGTVTLLKNVWSGANSGYGGNDNFGIANNLMFFSAFNGTNSGLWKSDGTGTGTTLVKYLYIDPNSPFVEMGGNIYFVAYDPLVGCYYEIWKSDGTAAGTMAVSASGCNPPAYSNVSALTKSGSYVYFNATDVNGDIELWKTDGTPAGTGLVKNIHTTASSDPKSLTDVNGTLFFAANSGTLGEELWKSDGTATGTVLVKNINTTSNTGSAPSSLIAYNGALYFFASSGTPGKELWKSDGTNAGTILLKDIYAGTGQGFYMDGTPKNKLMAIVGNKLYFFGRTGINGVELWRTDGTAAGTVMVKDLNPGATDCVNTAAGPGLEEGGHLCASGATLYLAAEGADYGTEPYVFSGAGLRMRDDSGIAEEMLSEGWSDWKTPEQNRFKLYPNPVANQFYIETELSMTLSLSEVSGKVIRTLSVSQGLNEINTEGLSSGVYLLQWQDENGESGVVKVVKE